MPDHDLTSEILPEFPAQKTPAENEPIRENEAADSNSITEKIGRAAAGVFERHGITFKRGRGRPRKDGSPAAADIPIAGGAASPNPSPAEAAAPPVDTFHGELFRRSVASAMRGLLDFAKNLCKSKATQSGIDRGFADKALSECDPEPQVLTDFSESLEIVLKKYKVKTDNAPEIALAVATCRLAAPYAMLLKTFNAEIKRKRALERSAAKPTGQ